VSKNRHSKRGVLDTVFDQHSADIYRAIEPHTRPGLVTCGPVEAHGKGPHDLPRAWRAPRRVAGSCGGGGRGDEIGRCDTEGERRVGDS
jgi:hypothetical protein